MREGAQWREEPLLPPQERRGRSRWAEVMRQPLLTSAPALGKAANRRDRESDLRSEPSWPSSSCSLSTRPSPSASLLGENPTVDEVVHLPAGVTYWQKGTFRLYPHNPPLVKLVAALPVVAAKPETDPAYKQLSWTPRDPSPATFRRRSPRLNTDRYFELFRPPGC